MRRKTQYFLNKADKAFAERLESLGLPYIYQATRFCLGNTTYTPDFYLPKDQVYYEIVGTRQAVSLLRQKIRRLRQLYPFVKIEIIRPDGSRYRFAKERREREGIGPQPIALELRPRWRPRKRVTRENSTSRRGPYGLSHLRLLSNGYLSVRMAAVRIARSPQCTLAQLKRGAIPGLYRDDGHYFVRRDVFGAWLKEQEKQCPV